MASITSTELPIYLPRGAFISVKLMYVIEGICQILKVIMSSHPFLQAEFA